MRSGHCASCDREIWKIVRHPKTREEFPLWPRKDSLYAVFWMPSGPAYGVGYCPSHCPEFGTDGPTLPQRLRTATGVQEVMVKFGACVGHETALGRYQAWYADQHGEVLQCWIREELNVDPREIMQEWERERAV